MMPSDSTFTTRQRPLIAAEPPADPPAAPPPLVPPDTPLPPMPIGDPPGREQPPITGLLR